MVIDLASCARCKADTIALWGDLCTACFASDDQESGIRIVDTSAPDGLSASAGVASMCLSSNHVLCMAVRCSCRCHGGEKASEA